MLNECGHFLSVFVILMLNRANILMMLLNYITRIWLSFWDKNVVYICYTSTLSRMQFANVLLRWRTAIQYCFITLNFDMGWRLHFCHVYLHTYGLLIYYQLKIQMHWLQYNKIKIHTVVGWCTGASWTYKRT
jgi:hypothetical protein